MYTENRLLVMVDITRTRRRHDLEKYNIAREQVQYSTKHKPTGET